MLKPGDVCVDIFGRLCLIVGAPVLKSQWYTVTFDGIKWESLKADWDYLVKIGRL